jgi:SAM-dependent methyltransferase
MPTPYSENAGVSEYDAFAPVYDDWSSHMTEDVPFYVELAREAEGPIVELAVGNGRVAIPVARETGRKVIGIDRSQAMLAVARERAEAEAVELELQQADMRDFDLDEPAALVYCPFRSLLHLPTWSDRRQVFERVAAALRPGGRFAWNSFVLNPHRAAASDGNWEVQAGVRHRIDHAPADNRIDITLESGDQVSLWWVTRGEWDALIDVSGLEVEALYGDFDRRPFDEESREFVWVTRKPE